MRAFWATVPARDDAVKFPFAALLQPTRFDDEAQDLRAAALHLALLVLIGGGVVWAAVTFVQDEDPSTRIVLVAAGLSAEEHAAATSASRRIVRP